MILTRLPAPTKMAPSDLSPTPMHQHQHHQRQQLHQDQVVSEYAGITAAPATPTSTPAPTPLPPSFIPPPQQDKYQDGASTSPSSSASSPRKPLAPSNTDTEFDYELDHEVLDLEDGYLPGINSDTKADQDWSCEENGNGWWGVKDIMTMTVRARRKGSLDSSRNGSVYRDEGKALLLDGRYTGTRWMKRRRGWVNYCVFGGISGLSILFVFLFLLFRSSYSCLLFDFSSANIQLTMSLAQSF